MPATWSGGMQLSSSAPTPISSKWRAARPNASPSGPPQCWPKTPHDAVAAAPEAQPHREPRVEQALHRRVGRRPHERQRLEQEQVRRLVAEQPREQPDGLEALRRVDVAVEAEGHRALLRAAALAGRLARELEAAPRDVHPVHGLRRAPQARAVVAQRARQAPGVRGDDVAADLDVAAVDVQHRGRRRRAARACPTAAPRAPSAGPRPRRARCHGAVEHDAAALRQQAPDPLRRRGPPRSSAAGCTGSHRAPRRRGHHPRAGRHPWPFGQGGGLAWGGFMNCGIEGA